MSHAIDIGAGIFFLFFTLNTIWIKDARVIAKKSNELSYPKMLKSVSLRQT